MIPAAIQALFDSRGWTPFDFQKSAWAAYLAGRGGLINAPTGVGKTWAAWLGPVIEGLQDGCHCSRVFERSSAGTAAPKSRRAVAPAKLAEPIRVLWLTPLRALASDTALSLLEPVTELGLNWSVQLRTGDTTQSLRRKQKERLPTALVTTPESLTLLLSYPDAADKFKTLRCVVVDEWHELIGSKRGVQTELALARLRTLAPGVRTWGVSATLGNLEQARDVLLGYPTTPGRRSEHDAAPSQTGGRDGVTGYPAELIRGDLPKRLEIATIIPPDVERFPWAGHLGTACTPQVIEAIRAANSTLLFTNTRSQAELWFRRLLADAPDLLGDLAIHHGSLDRGLRARVERMLADGRLKCVVCTSSLDLGVDFAPVDQVLQVGSPKGIARLMQRAGRSGHQPGARSRVLGVPAHAFELVEFAAARAAAAEGRVESRRPIERPLDVLVQHMASMACAGGFLEDDLRREVMSTYSYRNLTDADWSWAMDFVRRGGPALRAYPHFARVVATGVGRLPEPTMPSGAQNGDLPNNSLSIENGSGPSAALSGPSAGLSGSTGEASGPSTDPPGPSADLRGRAGDLRGPSADLPGAAARYVIASDRAARLHRMTIGTITADSSMVIKYASGRTLGHIEEGFIARLTAGSRFVFAGRVLEINRVRGMTVYVTRTRNKSGIVPRWDGGRFSLSTQLSAAVRRKLDAARAGDDADPEMQAVRPLIELQTRWSVIPAPNQLLVESLVVDKVHHVFLYPFLGRQVHEGLGALLAYRVARQDPATVTSTANDYGIGLRCGDRVEIDAPRLRALLSPDGLLDDLAACLNASNLARRQFRDIARIAGLIMPGFPGTQKPVKHLQASSEMFYDVFTEFDPGNLLLDQARREVLDNQFEIQRLRRGMEDAAAQEFVFVRPDRLTPLSFPIWAETLRQTTLSTEKWADMVRKMVLKLETASETSPKRRQGKGPSKESRERRD